MAYLYRHIRLDKNQPFYIGIGSQKTSYRRAKNKVDRNPVWKRVVSKTDYQIEIMLDDITWEDALQKEIEFIKLYGRLDHGGILANLTDGGEGQLGVSRPAWNKGKPFSEEVKRKFSESRKKMMSSKDYVHPNKGRKIHSEEKRKLWSESRLGQAPPNKGIVMSPEWRKNHQLRQTKLHGKPVVQFDINGVPLNIFPSITEAAKSINTRKSSVHHCCTHHRGRVMHKGFIWEYLKDVPPDILSSINNQTL